MRTDSKNILAINPGSRYMGIAVFHGGELYDWTLKVIPKARLTEVVSGFIRNHCVNVLALKKLHPSRSSRQLTDIVSKLKSVARQHGVRICEYSNDEMKMFFYPSDRISKMRIRDEVAIRYPFLIPELQHEQKLKTAYYLRMFEAVALGIVCFNKLDGKKEKGRK